MELDLNLLRIFDILMELRSVTRAADRLGLTQSAVSHALGRLRDALDDPLFVRGPQGFQPTARALEMAPGVREGLQRLNETLAHSRFDGPNQGRRFTLAAGPYVCALTIPPLVARAQAQAPGVSFRVVPVGDQLVPALDRGEIDLAFGAFARAPGRLVVEPLFDDEMVWIAAAGNTGAETAFHAGRIATLPQVTIVSRLPFDAAQPVTDESGLVSSYVSIATLDEATTVYDAQTAMALVAATDMVSLVPRRTAERGPGAVVVLGPGGERPLPIAMLWHARQRSDPGLNWLRARVREIA